MSVNINAFYIKKKNHENIKIKNISIILSFNIAFN